MTREEARSFLVGFGVREQQVDDLLAGGFDWGHTSPLTLYCELLAGLVRSSRELLTERQALAFRDYLIELAAREGARRWSG